MNTGGRRGKRHGAGAAFLLLYLLAAWIGRGTVPEGDQLSLVWPAGGIAVAWLISTGPGPRWAVDVPVLGAATAVIAFADGAGGYAATVLATSSVVGTVSVALLARRWIPAVAHDLSAPLTTPRAMLGFVAAAALGCLAGVTVGALGLTWTIHQPDVSAYAAWWGRNLCGVIAVATTALLLGQHLRERRTAAPLEPRRHLELVALTALTGSLALLDYVSPIPATLLLPAVTTWAGLRFAPLVVSLHACLGGAATLWLTLAHRGPFATVADPHAASLLAQVFVAMTLLIGLFLAAMREETAALQADLLARERERQQELRTFARRVAHDLKNPLTTIDLWTEQLSTCLAHAPLGTPAAAPDMIAGISRASQRMQTLVTDLLADATARDREARTRPVHLHEVVSDVARERDAVRVVGVDGGETVRADPVLLHQLVDNLVGNALKYRRPDEPPAVHFSSRSDGNGRVVVRVADRGIGIPDGAHEWIFEPFRRAHSGDIPGSGLGLSTCQRIVERHGGTIRAISRKDGPGTVFEFDLPAATHERNR